MSAELSAAERAYRILRDKIVALDLEPGAAIAETQAADMLGISRTPVREALARLAGEGLVDFRSRSGTIVSPIRMEAVRTAQYVRETLEIAVIRDAVFTSDRRLEFKARQALEEQQFAIEEGDTELFFAADDRLHRQFCRAAGRGGVWAIISEAKTHMDRVRRLSLESIDLGFLLQDHLDIVSAVRDGTTDDAERLMRAHLRRVLSDLDSLIAHHPDYFEAGDRQGADPEREREA